jgi:GT2 family glycosyltransferase
VRASVIVVSHGRPAALARCVAGVAQLDHPAFELVVVADPDGVAALETRPDAGRIKLLRFDTANIAQARNIGIAAAAAPVLAFIDDDAVPEPTWLDRLTAPFAADEVCGAGGFVRGRNGVSFQWQASSADAAGRRTPRAPDAPLPPGAVWRTEGTNMAFRAEALRGIGGFDPRFAFFLDETDVNLRLPGRTVIVPEAEVHHGFAESARRRADRVPRTLFEIGASSAYFLQKHKKSAETERLAELRCDERRRLLRHMVAGRLEPRDVRRLLADLEAGIAAGRDRAAAARDSAAPMRDAPPPFRPFRTTAPGAKLVLEGPWRRRKELESQAQAAAAQGLRPTLVLFAPDPRVLKVSFRLPGYWAHVGGQFGRGPRSDPALQWARRRARVAAEVGRIAPVRGLPLSAP